MLRLLLLLPTMVSCFALWLTLSRCRIARLLLLSLRRFPVGFGDAVWLKKDITRRRRLMRNFALGWMLLGILALLCWGWIPAGYLVDSDLKSSPEKYGQRRGLRRMFSNQ